MTPLMRASMLNMDPQVVTLLLQAGADLDATDAYGSIDFQVEERTASFARAYAGVGKKGIQSKDSLSNEVAGFLVCTKYVKNVVKSLGTFLAAYNDQIARALKGMKRLSRAAGSNS